MISALVSYEYELQAYTNPNLKYKHPENANHEQ